MFYCSKIENGLNELMCFVMSSNFQYYCGSCTLRKFVLTFPILYKSVSQSEPFSGSAFKNNFGISKEN